MIVLTKGRQMLSTVYSRSFYSYHPNLTFTVEENPDHFLDTSLNHQDEKFTTRVYQKPDKLQVSWKSAIPERWKGDTILGTLHREKRIAVNRPISIY